MHNCRLRGHTRLVAGSKSDHPPRDPHVRVTLRVSQLWARADVDRGGSATAELAYPLEPGISREVDSWEVWAASTHEEDAIEVTFVLRDDQDFDYLERLLADARTGLDATRKLAPSPLTIIDGGAQ